MIDLLELLSALEHDRWSRWQRYVHAMCEQGEDGALVIPGSLVHHWQRQATTPYAHLSERERENIRQEADATVTLVRRNPIAVRKLLDETEPSV